MGERMNTYDLQGITLLTFVRLDNNERIKNLIAMHKFYRTHCTNYTHIIVEDDKTQNVPAHLNFHKDDVYVYTISDTEWKKCEGYNKGIKLAKTNIIVFNDVDVIIHPEQLLEGSEALTSDTNAGLIYPYNGLFLNVAERIKDEFIAKCEYSTLHNTFPSELDMYEGTSMQHNTYQQYIGKTYDNMTLDHINSKGGCVMGRRDNLIKCNGYNPLFAGWGYEDDEMPSRVHKLGYTVGRISGTKKPCWHLHHNDGTGSARESQEFHEYNCIVANKVDRYTKEQLNEYIKQWVL